MRRRMYTIRLSEEERARFVRLAEHYGLNAAGFFRMILKREEQTLDRDRANVNDAD